MNLRDHDQTCEHPHFFEGGSQTDGWRTSHPVVGSDGQRIGSIVCPGGAAVNIDYDQARIAVHAYTAPFGVMTWDLDETVLTSTETAKLIVNAALGLTDD